MRNNVKRASNWYAWPAVLLVQAQAVLAAEEADGEAGVNIFGGDLGIAIWTLLIFALVVFVLRKFAWGPLLSQLQKREAFIRESLSSARKEREQAEARLREYEQQLARAREEASAIVEEGRRDAEETAKRIMVEARQSVKQEQERAIREIDIARKTALKDLYDQSAHLAMNMAGTVLKRELKADDHERLIEEALSQIREHPPGAN